MRVERRLRALLWSVPTLVLLACGPPPVYVPLGGAANTAKPNAARWDAVVSTLAADLIHNLRREDKTPLKVAVLDFSSPAGAQCPAGASIAEALTTALFNSGEVVVIERRQLASVERELEVSISERMDPGDVAKLGRLVGVSGIVLGTMSPAAFEYRINARLILVETAAVVSAAGCAMARIGVEQNGGCGG
jgi:TolB-like protein